jgi:putative phosphoesterase
MAEIERLAVLSDIHGVLPALEAVLAEPDVAAADRIALTGDLAAGPQPVETLDLLASLGDRAIWIRGNADRELAEMASGQHVDPPDEVSPWAAKQLHPRHAELLAGPSERTVVTVAGLSQVMLCHATPRNDTEVVLVDSRMDRWTEVLDGLGDEVTMIVCGHTHMPFARLAHGRMIVNPGSVGMPYGRTGAHWALLGPGVQLRRTRYDAAAASARLIAESGYRTPPPGPPTTSRPRPSDAEAIEAFARRRSPGIGRRQPGSSAVISAYWASVSSISAAPTFSSRCSAEPVPGIGIMTGTAAAARPGPAGPGPRRSAWPAWPAGRAPRPGGRTRSGPTG